MEIITGRTGTPHVRASDDAEIYKLFLGDGDIILSTGNQFNAQRSASLPNTIEVWDGSLIMQGRLSKIRADSVKEDVQFDVGVSGYKRVDYIVAEYNQTTTQREEEISGEVVTINDNIESVELKVIKGTPNASTWAPPTLITGNIDLGQKHQVLLWEIRLDGMDFDSLIDHRARLVLDTTPIQMAINLARNYEAEIRQRMTTLSGDVTTYINEIHGRMDTLRTETLAYADDLLESVSAGFKGSWRKTVTVSDSSQPISVAIDGYTYTLRDIVEVYLEGLRLERTEYAVADDNGAVEITLNSGTFTGQMEVVVYRISEEA